MQPPTIPHKIDNYQVDKNVNACLGCHSRGRAPVTQAVAVSVSHYMDRDGNFLAEISPRRYFCEQCHVVAGRREAARREPLRGRGRDRQAHGRPRARRRPRRRRSMRCSLDRAGRTLLGHHQPPERALQPRASSSSAAFIAGIVFWGGFNTAMELTNTEAFCTGCHEMRDNVYQELQRTIHYTNRSGVRAKCPDCHVPAQLDAQDRAQDAGVEGSLGQDLRHDRHAREVRREAPRARAARVGAHEGERLARVPQLPRLRLHGLHAPEPARRVHALDATSCTGERTCIDCHKGIAHRLPDMGTASASR